MWYFAIYSSEDGDISVTRLSKEELEARLDEDYWGGGLKFLTAGDDIEANTGLMIIKGEQVIPKPKKVVEAWEV